MAYLCVGSIPGVDLAGAVSIFGARALLVTRDLVSDRPSGRIGTGSLPRSSIGLRMPDSRPQTFLRRTRNQLATEQEFGVEMDFVERVPIVVTGGSEKLTPEFGVILPPQAQLTAVTVRNAGELLGRESSDNIGHARRHAQREPRHTPIPFYAVPREDQGLLHQWLGKLRGPVAGTNGSLARSVAQLNDLLPPRLVCEVRIKDHKWKACRPLDGLRTQSGPQFTILGDTRQFARHGTPGDGAQQFKGALVEPVDHIQRFPAFPSWRQGRAIDAFFSGPRFGHVHPWNTGAALSPRALGITWGSFREFSPQTIR
jgi:hypothetical protein